MAEDATVAALQSQVADLQNAAADPVEAPEQLTGPPVHSGGYIPFGAIMADPRWKTLNETKKLKLVDNWTEGFRAYAAEQPGWDQKAFNKSVDERSATLRKQALDNSHSSIRELPAEANAQILGAVEAVPRFLANQGETSAEAMKRLADEIQMRHTEPQAYDYRGTPPSYSEEVRTDEAGNQTKTSKVTFDKAPLQDRGDLSKFAPPADNDAQIARLTAEHRAISTGQDPHYSAQQDADILATRTKDTALADAIKGVKDAQPALYGVNPATRDTIPAKIARAAGDVAPMFTAGGAAVGIPSIIGSTFSSAADQAIAEAKAKGETDPEHLAQIGHDAGAGAVVESAPTLAAYTVGGPMAGAAADALTSKAGPVVKAVVGGGAAAAANLTVSGTSRVVESQQAAAQIDADASLSPEQKAAAKARLPGFIGDASQNFTDLAFGVHGGYSAYRSAKGFEVLKTNIHQALGAIDTREGVSADWKVAAKNNVLSRVQDPDMRDRIRSTYDAAAAKAPVDAASAKLQPDSPSGAVADATASSTEDADIEASLKLERETAKAEQAKIELADLQAEEDAKAAEEAKAKETEKSKPASPTESAPSPETPPVQETPLPVAPVENPPAAPNAESSRPNELTSTAETASQGAAQAQAEVSEPTLPPAFDEHRDEMVSAAFADPAFREKLGSEAAAAISAFRLRGTHVNELINKLFLRARLKPGMDSPQAIEDGAWNEFKDIARIQQREDAKQAGSLDEEGAIPPPAVAPRPDEALMAKEASVTPITDYRATLTDPVEIAALDSLVQRNERKLAGLPVGATSLTKAEAAVKTGLANFLVDRSAKLKLRADAEGGFVNADILSEAVDFGKQIYQRGMDFVQWSAEMIRHLGEKIKEHLSRIWSAVKSQGDERGSVGGNIGLNLNGESGSQRAHKSAQHILDNEAFSDRVKERVRENMTYAPQGADESQSKAKAILDSEPTLHDAIERFKTDHSLDGGVRMSGMIESLKYISEAQQELPPHQAAALHEVGDDLTRYILETAGPSAGRMIERMKELQSPLTWVRDYQKPIIKAQAEKLSTDPVATKIKDAVIKGTEEAATKAVKVKGKLLESAQETRAVKQKLTDTKATKGIWQQYSDAIGASVNNMIDKEPTLRGPLQEFAGAAGEAIRGKARELIPSETIAQIAKPGATATVHDLIRNSPQVQATFETAKAKLAAEHPGDPRIEAFLQSTLDTPFSADQLKGYARENNVDLAKLSQEHFTKTDQAGRTLAEKMIAEGGVEGTNAVALAKSVTTEVAKQVKESKARQLEQLVKQADKKATPKEIKDTVERLINMVNLGAFDHERFYNAVAQRFKLPAFDPNVAESIKKRAEAVQMLPEDSRLRAKAATDLRDFIQLQTPESLTRVIRDYQTGQMLGQSGTGIVVPVATMLESNANVLLMAAMRPQHAPAILRAWWKMMIDQDFGSVTANEVKMLLRGDFTAMNHGVNAFTGRVSSNLERMHTAATKGLPFEAKAFGKTFKLPAWFAGQKGLATAMRYSGRWVAAAHSMWRSGASEARMMREVIQKVSEEKPADEAAFNLRVAQEMGYDRTTIDKAKAQARSEFEKAGINDSAAEQLRVFDLVRSTRDQRLQGIANNFGTTVTSSADPYGNLGLVAKTVGNFTEKVPLVNIAGVKFLRTASNVENLMGNWLPIYSAKRLFFGTGTNLKEKAPEFYRPPGKVGSAEWDIQLGKTLLSHAIFGGLIGLGTTFLKDADPAFMVIGNGPDDADLKKQMAQKGWKANSFKIGSTYYRFDKFPGAAMYHAVGNYFDAQRYGNQPAGGVVDHAERIGVAIVSIPFTILNMEMLGGVSKLLEIGHSFSSGANGEKAGKKALRDLLEMETGSLVPFGPISKDIERIIADPKQADNAMEHFIRSVPIASWTLNPQLDMFGKDVHRTVVEHVPFSHRFLGVESSDPVYQFMVQNGFAIHWPETAKLMRMDPATGDPIPVEMTTEQHYKWVKDGGPVIYEQIKDMLPELQQMPYEQVKSTLADIVRQAQDTAASGIEEGLAHGLKGPSTKLLRR